MHYTVLKPLTAIAIFSAILLYSSNVFAGQDPVDWWKTQHDVTAILMEQGASIAKLSVDVNVTTTPKNTQDAMFKLCVLMRAGMNKEAIDALRELKAFSPEMDNHQVVSIYYYACDSILAWDVAKATVEVFAGNISEMALENRLLKHLLNSGWTVEKVDKWMAAMPSGRNSFWVKERLRFNTVHGRGERLVRELTKCVKKNPKDIDGVIAFLDGLIYSRHTGTEEWDLSWMTEVIHPDLATEAEQIASRLKTLNEWMMAIRFYQQAIDTPLIEDESQKLGMMCSVFVPAERLCAMFAVHAREGMAKCLLKLDKKEQAQKWMVAAADIRKKHNLGLNALFAGQVQGESGQRTIEGRIKEEEKKSEKDPQYWRDRAQYYRGRNEPAQEEEALLKGLTLTTPQPEPGRRHKGHVDWRSWLLVDYARFLMREKRIDEAVALLRKEIEQAPAVSESTKRAANLLAFDLCKQISVDDPVLWNWLANRPKWEHTEERLLWRMLESANRDNLDKHFIHAEKATLGKDPSRARTLGWIMNRMHFPKRSIPLLKYAVENAHDEELKERTHFTLLESYLDTGDWKHAEGIFPQAAKRLTAKELPEWYSRVAVSAAKAGAKTDAMRIWIRVSNLSPSQIDGLKDLAEVGLKNELKEFYHEMQRQMPSSEVPERALIALEKE